MDLAKLPPSRQFAILAKLGYVQVDTRANATLGSCPSFYLWVAGLLERLPQFSGAIHDQILTHLLKAQPRLFPVPGEEPQPARLVVADEKFVTGEVFDGKFLSVATGELVDQLPRPPFKSVIYDLTELFRRNAEYCLTEGPPRDRNPGEQDMAGRMDEPRHVRQRPAGDVQ